SSHVGRGCLTNHTGAGVDQVGLTTGHNRKGRSVAIWIRLWNAGSEKNNFDILGSIRLAGLLAVRQGHNAKQDTGKQGCSYRANKHPPDRHWHRNPFHTWSESTTD